VARVTVVMDTTAYLPRDVTDRAGIKLVSLYYSFGDDAPSREADLEDWSLFYDRLRTAETPPTTSPPTVQDFLAIYEPLLTGGGSVISLHISSGLSETCAVARRAVEELITTGKAGDRIRVMDSASTAGQLGALALVAARAAAAGDDLETVFDLVRQARTEARQWFLLDTLEYLRRGGRVGSAAAWIGSTLKIKPILSVESEMKAVERVRTRERGIDRLMDYGRQLHAAGANAWWIQHNSVPEEADTFVERLKEIFLRPPEFRGGVGPVIGTHTGPGLLGVGGLPPRFLE